MSFILHKLTNRKDLLLSFDQCCCQVVGKVCWCKTVSRETELIALPSSPIGCHSAVTGIPALPFVHKSIRDPNEIVTKSKSFETTTRDAGEHHQQEEMFVFFQLELCVHRTEAKLSQTSSKFYWMLELHVFRRRVRSANVKSLKQVVVFVGSLSLYLHLSLPISPSLHRFLSQ